MMPDSNLPKICDYEGSDYRTEFWEGQGREYEDRVERIALRRMLPGGGRRLLELGAGFGRLTDEYRTFDQVVLLDYSLSQLQFAQDYHGKSDKYIYVAADIYKLPFREGIFDVATMIRVIHHMADVPSVLGEVRRTLVPGAVFILEHANKRNLKAIIRYALGKQRWNPHTLDPIEFIELNFDFHPAYIVQELQAARFDVAKRIPISFFRLALLKQLLSDQILVTLDSLLQFTGALYTPSVFTRNIANNEGQNNLEVESIFACPQSGGELIREGDTLICQDSGLRYAIRDGIYDFKVPLE